MKLIKFNLLTVLFFIFSISQLHAAVWEADKEWNALEEEKYSQWVKTNWTSDIFTNESSPYYQFPSDCADAGYSMRMIYAYENKLPFVIYSKRLKRILSNKITKWDRHQDKYLAGALANVKDSASVEGVKEQWKVNSVEYKKLFLFMRLVNDITSTWSLPNDTYPVALGPENVKAGLVVLVRRYHTFTLKNTDEFGTISTLASTTPIKVRELGRGSSLTTFFRYKYEEGLLAFRWPHEAKKASHRVSRASMEQYDLWNDLGREYLKNKGDDDFETKSLKSLSEQDNFGILKLFRSVLKNGNSDITPMATSEENIFVTVSRKMEELCAYAQQRSEVVRDAARYREEVGGRCLNESEVYEYSTPSRDKKFKRLYEEYVDLTKENINQLFASTQDYEKLKAMYALVEASYVFSHSSYVPKYFSDNTYCPIETYSGRTLPLDIVSFMLISGKLSSDPNDPIEQRWGFETYGNDCNVPVH